MPQPHGYQTAISNALKTIIAPGTSADVIKAGWTRHVELDEGTVKIVYEVPQDKLTDDAKETLHAATVEAIRNVDGIEKVNVTIAAKPPERGFGPIPGVRHVIAVGAGKGGVGKSTVSTLLAVSLHKKGYKVGLLDGDVYGPSLPKMTGTEDAQPMIDPDTGKIFPPDFDGVKLLSMGFIINPDQAVIWRGPMAQKYIKEFLERADWGELDYLIVDLPPGTGDIPLTLAQSIPLSGSVVVCTPQDVALLDAVRAVKMYEKLKVPTLGLIENMSFYCCPNCGDRAEIFGHGGVKKSATELGVPYLGGLPINLKIREAGDAGTPFVNLDGGDSAVSDAIEELADAFLEQIGKQAKRHVPLPQIKISG